MATYDSGNPPPTSEYIRRWTHAMENLQYDSALAILDEGLQAAARENNAEQINQELCNASRVLATAIEETSFTAKP